MSNGNSEGVPYFAAGVGYNDSDAENFRETYRPHIPFSMHKLKPLGLKALVILQSEDPESTHRQYAFGLFPDKDTFKTVTPTEEWKAVGDDARDRYPDLVGLRGVRGVEWQMPGEWRVLFNTGGVLARQFIQDLQDERQTRR